MDTVTNLSNSASKAIWGEQQTGNNQQTTTTDTTTNPNASNTSTSNDPNTTSSTSTPQTHAPNTTGTSSKSSQPVGEDREMHKSMIDDVERPGAPSNGRFETDPDAKEGHFDENAAKKDDSKKDASDHTKNTGTTGDTDSRPAGGVNTGGSAQPQTAGGIQQGQNTNAMSNSNEPNTGFGGAGAQPSVGADVSDADKKESHQGGERPMENPDNQSKDDNKGDNKGDNKSSGGAPKPLGGGGAGGGGVGGGAAGGMKPDPGQGTGEGTGEKYEKSTGVQADGGDFDATRPGAGREADRLMEEAGITHGEKPRLDDEAKSKKSFSVDSSGFGGHGSHTNKSTSGKSSIDDKAEAAQDKHVVGSDPGKKSIVEKVKEKIHHS